MFHSVYVTYVECLIFRIELAWNQVDRSRLFPACGVAEWLSSVGCCPCIVLMFSLIVLGAALGSMSPCFFVNSGVGCWGVGLRGVSGWLLSAPVLIDLFFFFSECLAHFQLALLLRRSLLLASRFQFLASSFKYLLSSLQLLLYALFAGMYAFATPFRKLPFRR